MINLLPWIVVGCAGWVGDSGVVQCPDLPTARIGFDEVLPGLDLAVEDFPMFAASPARVSLSYADGRTTSLSLRIDPVRAVVRTATSPVLVPIDERRCEEVVASYRIEGFTDDGAFDWVTEAERVVEDPDDTERLTLAVPFVANLGAPPPGLAESTRELLDANPDLAAASVRPVAYELVLDLTDVAPAGAISLLLAHDPVSSDVDSARTVTGFVVGTF